MPGTEDDIETYVGPTRVERNTKLASFSGEELARVTLEQVGAPADSGARSTAHRG